MTKKKIRIEAKTDEELKQIAKALWAGQIFCDRYIHKDQAHLLKSVFMSLYFISKKTALEMKRRKVNFIYEYKDKAGPRSINGMPMFMSCQMLAESETEKMFEFYDKFKKMADEL